MIMSQNKIHEILSGGHWCYSFDRVGCFLLRDDKDQIIGDYTDNRFYWNKKFHINMKILIN